MIARPNDGFDRRLHISLDKAICRSERPAGQARNGSCDKQRYDETNHGAGAVRLTSVMRPAEIVTGMFHFEDSSNCACNSYVPGGRPRRVKRPVSSVTVK